MKFQLDHFVTGYRGIGVLRLYGDGESKHPTVMVLHGLSSSKENQLVTMYRLAEFGFDVIAPDLFLHGERPEAMNRQALLDDDLLGTVSAIIYESVSDLPIVCAEIGVDWSEIGILGISMGGLVAHALAVDQPKFKVLVGAIASPDWLTVDPSIAPPPHSVEAMVIAEMSPVNHPGKYAPLALCMLNGDSDDRVTHYGSVELYRRLLPIYREAGIADRLHLTIYPGLGHQFTEAMLETSIDWFERFLKV